MKESDLDRNRQALRGEVRDQSALRHAFDVLHLRTSFQFKNNNYFTAMHSWFRGGLVLTAQVKDIDVLHLRENLH